MPHDQQDDPRFLIYQEQKPWGSFRRFTHNQMSTLKIITVNPGQSLSLQLHCNRDELWVILDPGLQVTVGERTWKPEPCEEIYIPRQTHHRATGVGLRPSRWLEIALGEFDERDIVRLEDRYGRK